MPLAAGIHDYLLIEREFPMRNIWLVLLLSGSMAHAASFDCTKAKTPLEKAICALAKLSVADDQMATAY
jgi:uncharacterized protein